MDWAYCKTRWETINFGGFGVAYIRGLTVPVLAINPDFCKHDQYHTRVHNMFVIYQSSNVIQVFVIQNT